MYLFEANHVVGYRTASLFYYIGDAVTKNKNVNYQKSQRKIHKEGFAVLKKNEKLVQTVVEIPT